MQRCAELCTITGLIQVLLPHQRSPPTSPSQALNPDGQKKEPGEHLPMMSCENLSHDICSPKPFGGGGATHRLPYATPSLWPDLVAQGSWALA